MYLQNYFTFKFYINLYINTSSGFCQISQFENIKDDLITFAKQQLEQYQPRDDYKELLELTIIFLGDTPDRDVHFLALCGLHRARWMAKAIYAIKIWMFGGQFPLTRKEERGLNDLAVFVVGFYVKNWYQAPLPTQAPANDLQLLKDLHDFKTTNKNIADAALKKLQRHPWYLNEEMVGLAFFDRRVDIETKRKMVLALQNEGEGNVPKRISIDAKHSE